MSATRKHECPADDPLADRECPECGWSWPDRVIDEVAPWDGRDDDFWDRGWDRADLLFGGNW